MNICLNCKAEFIAKHQNQLYCSDKCRKEVREKRYESFKRIKPINPMSRIIKCNSQTEQEEDLHGFCLWQEEMREQGKHGREISYGAWQTKKFFGR